METKNNERETEDILWGKEKRRLCKQTRVLTVTLRAPEVDIQLLVQLNDILERK